MTGPADRATGKSATTTKIIAPSASGSSRSSWTPSAEACSRGPTPRTRGRTADALTFGGTANRGEGGRLEDGNSATIRDTARYLALECAMCRAVAGVQQHLPPLGSDAFLPMADSPRGAPSMGDIKWAFYQSNLGTGFELGGG